MSFNLNVLCFFLKLILNGSFEDADSNRVGKEKAGGHLYFKVRKSYPNFNVSPLAKPLLARFGGREFRHFFTIQLQNT